MVIDKGWISLSTLSFIWASFSILMFGSAILFLDWRCTSINKSKSSAVSTKEEG